jgi:hypothetical protein
VSRVLPGARRFFSLMCRSAVFVLCRRCLPSASFVLAAPKLPLVRFACCAILRPLGLRQRRNLRLAQVHVFHDVSVDLLLLLLKCLLERLKIKRCAQAPEHTRHIDSRADVSLAHDRRRGACAARCSVLVLLVLVLVVLLVLLLLLVVVVVVVVLLLLLRLASYIAARAPARPVDLTRRVSILYRWHRRPLVTWPARVV